MGALRLKFAVPSFRQLLCVLVAVTLAGTARGAPLLLQPMSGFGGGDGFVAAGERAYLRTSGDTERGMAYNALTNRVYVLSRATGVPRVAVLDGDSGDDVTGVTLDGLVGGFFTASHIRVADDGAIYVANLTAAAGSTTPYKVYRYADEQAMLANAFSVAYEGQLSPGNRYGDNFNVRGSGTATQFITGGGANSNDVVVFTTADGETFSPTIFDIGGSEDHRLGVAFGAGNTFYSKGSAGLGGPSMRLVQFATDPPSFNVLRAFADGEISGLVSPIDVDPGLSLLAGVRVQTGADQTELYDVTQVLLTPPLLDSEPFGIDRANTNRAGALDFADGRLYVLNTNNGIQALSVVPEAVAALWTLAAVGLPCFSRAARRSGAAASGAPTCRTAIGSR